MDNLFVPGIVCGVLVSGLIWAGLIAISRRSGFGAIGQQMTTGVLSGIFVAILIYVAGYLATQVALPWYQKKFFKGLDISGHWKVALGKGGSHSKHLQMDADLLQVADRVTGVLVMTYKNDPHRGVRRFAIKGVRQEQYFAATYEKTNKKQRGIGTSLLDIVEVGDKMLGYICAFDSGDSKLRCDAAEWVRVGEGD